MSQPRFALYLTLVLLGSTAQQVTAGTITWLTGGGGSWNVGSNWSTGSVPTATDDVTIVAGGFQPTIGLNGSAQSLTINSSATLTVADLNVLTISSTGGTSIANAGSLIVSGALQNSDLAIQGTGTVALTGAGTLSLAGPDSRFYANNTGMTVSNSSTISGQGTIGGVAGTFAFTLNNSGTINANVNGAKLTIAELLLTNTGTLEATNGGILDLHGNVTNTGQTITADNATVQLGTGANLTGGTLSAVNGGSMTAGVASSISGTVDLNAGLTVTAGSDLTLQDGTTLNINSAKGGSVNLANTSIVELATGTTTLGGTGTLTLNDTSSNATVTNLGAAILNSSVTIEGQGTLRQSSGNTLTINNTGTINANVNGATLSVLNGVTNNTGTYEATNGGTLRISGQFNNVGGVISADNGTVANVGGTITGGTLQTSNGGQITVSAGSSLGGTAALNGTLNVLATGDLTLVNGANVSINGASGGSLNVANGGFLIVDGSVTLSGTGALTLNDAQASPFTVIGTSGANTLTNGATIQGQGRFVFTSNSLTLNNNGLVHSNQGGSLVFDANVQFNNAGEVEIDLGNTMSILGGETQTAGTTQVDGQLTTTTIALQGGTLDGSGTVIGNVNNTGGDVAPGDSPGTLTINGLYSQSNGGKLDIQIASLLSYDVLAVSGTANVGGALNVSLLGYTGHVGDVFTILTSGGLTGNFSTLNLPTLSGLLFFQESTDPNDVFLTVEQGTVPEPSTMLLVGAGLAAAFALRRKMA